MSFTVVHLPELAINAVHPPRALDERYRFGIPIALLSSQLAIGICTKKKLLTSNWDEKVRIWLGEMKEPKLIQN